MNSDSSDPGSQSLLKRITRRLIPQSQKSTAHSFNSHDLEGLTPVQREMIAGVIDLSSKNARDIMIPRVDVRAVEQSTGMKSLIGIIEEAGHSRLPVYGETIDNVIGILYVKELIPLLLKKPAKFQLKKLVHQPFFVPETMPLEELLFEFKKRKLHLAVVVDEYGGMSGIVTMEDVLEEIVGEIRDEFDTEELPEIVKTGKNSWDVDPRMPIADFNESLGCSINTEGGFDTIGGLVLNLFGRIPEKDDTISHERVTFRIKGINGTVIGRISVTMSGKK